MEKINKYAAAIRQLMQGFIMLHRAVILYLTPNSITIS
jgi:hypothetical protein